MDYGQKPQKIRFRKESYAIQGAVFEVYREVVVDFSKRSITNA